MAGKVINGIPFDEYKKLHPEQWIKLYGVIYHSRHYLITCQVYQLEVVINSNQRNWWDGFLLEPVDEEEQPVPLEEAFLKSQHF